MRATACVVLVGLFGLCGCGGGSGDDDDDVSGDAAANLDAATLDAAALDAGAIDGGWIYPPDAGLPGFDASHEGDCDPVLQTGCGVGQKCAYVVDVLDPLIGHVGCAADGVDAIGAACTEAAVPGTSDSCAKGGYCHHGYCREICSTLADTCMDGQCADFLDDWGNPFPIEWCVFSCDPLAQDCAISSEACFLSNGEGICLEHGDLSEGDPCLYTNSCDTGTQCFGPAGMGVCRRLCGMIDEHWGDDGGGLLTWPICCGTDCGATVDCAGSNEMCWVVSDGTDTGIADIGICLTDVEASNPDGSVPWTCDCSSATAEKCALD